jgi:hypothetical protein
MKVEDIQIGIVTTGKDEALAHFKSLSWLWQEKTEDSHEKCLSWHNW